MAVLDSVLTAAVILAIPDTSTGMGLVVINIAWIFDLLFCGKTRYRSHGESRLDTTRKSRGLHRCPTSG